MKGGRQIFGYGQEMFGSGTVIFQWSMDFQFICGVGQNQGVQIFDKRGNKIKEMQSQVKAPIKGIEWDKDNEFIGIMYENCNFITLWNVFASGIQSQQMEMDNVKFKASFMKWSKTHPVLAIGTDKGSVIFFNKNNQKKVPTMGKHAKKVTTGDWNDEGLLITGGEDKILTVSNHTSESKSESMSLNHEAKFVKWARQKTDDRSASSNTITAILQNKSLLMFQFESKKQPLELFFEQKYGKVTDYQLFGDGYLVVGFSEGYISHISTHMKEVRDEVSSEQVFTSSISALATNDTLHKLAVASEHTIKMMDLSTWKCISEEKIEVPVQAGRIIQMGWTSNGQVLVASTANGGLFGYMTHVPLLLNYQAGLVVMLTSFKEVSLLNLNQLPSDPPLALVGLECEPSHLALSPNYLATAINNIVWFYKLAQKSVLILKKEYSSSIKSIIIQGNIVAIFSASKVTLHNIDVGHQSQYFEKRFPSNEKEKGIVHGTLTENFLIVVDTSHKIKYFNVYDQQMSIEYQSEYKLAYIYSNKSGSRCICIDTQGHGYLFLAASEQLIRIGDFPNKCNQVVWDEQQQDVVGVIDNHQVYTLNVQLNALHGPQVVVVPQLLSLQDVLQPSQPVITQLDKKVQGICLTNGTLHCYGQDGTISTQVLQSHNNIRFYQFEQDTQENHFRYFLQCLSLNKFNLCLFPAEKLKNDELYETLGRKCLQNMEFEIGYQAFQKAHNLSMVMTIEKIMQEREKNIIYGHVAMILGQYDLAMDLYLKSSQPVLALDMRCDIQDWMVALNLAKSIAPQQEPLICRKLAQQVESQGNFSEAQRLYEKGILEEKDEGKVGVKIEEHNVQCFAGIARTSIKLGDVNRGFQLANQLGESEPQHLIEIALVCENMKQLFEAAQLYQKAQLVEKAASLYIQLKMFDFATPLISQIKSPKLLSQLAKSKEIEGNYLEAEKAYEKAENWENVIRLNLNQLDDLEKAKTVLRNKCPTDNCANMVAVACEKKGLKKDAIEFLLLGQKKDEAFALAQTHDCMEIYVDNSHDIGEEDRLKVAQYFEGRGAYHQAAKHYELSGNFIKSLNLYKKAGEDYLDACVEMIGRAKNDSLTLSLLAYIMGEDDGIPKDPHYAYKVYRVLEKYSEASKIALTIWSQEMERGNYQQAHYYLFDIQRDLTSFNLQVPYEIHQKLMILHSYMIVKRVIRLGFLEEAVMLLNRVCKNISQFQQHALNILTYTVIQATKAKMKGVAYVWSSALCRQEHRGQINEKYRKNIENIARRPVPEDTYNQLAPCPFCQHSVNQFDLFCERCQQNIPFCIASGKHIIKEELCFCPSCNFPAIYEHFKNMMLEENCCPMCNNQIDIASLEIKPDLITNLNNQQSKESQPLETQE